MMKRYFLKAICCLAASTILISSEACAAGSLLHGEAVGLGMLCFAGGGALPRIRAVLEKYSLPTGSDIPREALLEKIQHDKKADGDTLTVVRVETIGSYRFEQINIQDLEI